VPKGLLFKGKHPYRYMALKVMLFFCLLCKKMLYYMRYFVGFMLFFLFLFGLRLTAMWFCAKITMKK